MSVGHVRIRKRCLFWVMYILMEVGVQEYHQTTINVIDLMVISVLILKTILLKMNGKKDGESGKIFLNIGSSG